MSNAHGLQVVGIAPGHLGKTSREDFPLVSYLSTQNNLFASSAESDNAEEPEPLPDAAELKRQNDERLDKILREARIQLQQKGSCAWQDPKSGEGNTGESKPSGGGNLVLSGKNDKDAKLVEIPTEASGETNNGSPPANVEDGEKAKPHSQQKGLGSDPTVNRQNAIERLRRMEWQRNKTDSARAQVELHALPPKRDLAAEEADASEDARGKSKGRNRRRSRQQQQLVERPQLVVAPPPPPFPGVCSRTSDVSPFWRSSKSAQEDDRTTFPARVNVWLQRPGVDLFPKQPITDSELEKVDELASATEEKMFKMALEASLKTAEEEGTILLPQPPRSTKSTFVQPPPLENEDWEADIDDTTDSERNATDKLSTNGTDKQKMDSNDKNSENNYSETKIKAESVSSASKGYTDHTTMPSTVNYSRRVSKNDNHATSWYQSSSKDNVIRIKGEGRARNSIYTEEKNSEKIVQWRKPIEESELSTDSHRKNAKDRFQPESINSKKTTGIYNESRVGLKEAVPKERWISDWKDRTNDFNEKLSNKNIVTGRKHEEASEKYISDVTSSRDHQVPKEQRAESKRRNRQGSLQSSEDDSRQDSKKDNEVAIASSDTCMNVHSMHFRNNAHSLTVNTTRENSKNAEEDNSVCNRAEGDLSNSSQNSFQNSFTNVRSKSANTRDFTVSSATHRGADLNVQVNVTQRDAVWNAETRNNSHQYEEKLCQEQSNCNHQLQQPGQVLKQEEVTVAEKAYDNRDCTSGRVPISSPPGLRRHEQQRNEQASKDPDSDSVVKHASESKPPEQESSVDEFFRKYAQHNSTSGQAIKLPDGNMPMGAFRVGGPVPGLGMQPSCAPAPVIQGAAGVPAIHPAQIRVCGVPQMYQPCGMLPDMGTALPYNPYAYVDGTGQRPLMENHPLLQSNGDCCPVPTPQSSSRFGGNCGERPAVVPVTPSSQSPEGVYPSYGSCPFEGGQQAFSGNHLGGLLKSGAMPGYGNLAAAPSPLMPVEVMMPGLGTTHPTGVPPPPGVFAYSAVTPLTGVSPPRCSQLQQGLVLQPMQVPQENISDRQVTARQENSTASSVQDTRGSQVYSSATQGIPQVPQAGGVSQNTQVTSGNGQTPTSQESSHTALNRSTKSQVPPGNISNPNPATLYSSGQPNDMAAFLALHQNGISDSQDVTAVGMSQWPLCCFSQPDLTQLQGVPQIMNPDGTVSHFPDMAHFGIPQPFKQPVTPLVDHIWYAGPPLLPVHDRNNQTKQFSNIPDARLDTQAAMVPQMRVTHGAQMSQFGPESQQLNDPPHIYFPGIGHVPTQTQLSTPPGSTVGQTSVPPGLPPQPQFAQGAVQQQMGFVQHPPGILHAGMSHNVNNLATAGNAHRNASAQTGAAAVLKGRIVSESTVGDGQSVDSKNVQKMSRGQSSQDNRYPFPGDGNRADVSYLAEKLRQSSLSQRVAGQGLQTTATPQGTFQSIPSVPGSTPKAQLYYEKVQSLLCQPPDVVSRLLQQMHLNSGVAPVTDPSGGPAVGPQGFVVPPAPEVWPVVQNAQVVQERLHPSQSQGGFAVSARSRGKGRGRLRDVDG